MHPDLRPRFFVRDRVTFMPQCFLVLAGMTRRMYTYRQARTGRRSAKSRPSVPDNHPQIDALRDPGRQFTG